MERDGHRGLSFPSSTPEFVIDQGSSLPQEDESRSLFSEDSVQNTDLSNKYINPDYTISNKIRKGRERFKLRKTYRKLIESSLLSNTSDDRPFANIKILNETFYGLLDSGASVSVLGNDSLAFLERNQISLKSFKSFISTADGSKNDVLGHCKLPVFYKGVMRNIDFYVVPSLGQKVYLGLDFWQKFAIAPNIIPAIESVELDNPENANVCFHELNAEQKMLLESVVSEFPAFEKLGLGRTHLLSHDIDTGDSVPIKCKHYPLFIKSLIGCWKWE